MDLQKYNGNIHPDEWINDIITNFNYNNKDIVNSFNIAKSLVDPAIKLPAEVDDYEKLRNALEEDISFTVFKNTNKRKLIYIQFQLSICTVVSICLVVVVWR